MCFPSIWPFDALFLDAEIESAGQTVRAQDIPDFVADARLSALVAPCPAFRVPATTSHRIFGCGVATIDARTKLCLC